MEGLRWNDRHRRHRRNVHRGSQLDRLRLGQVIAVVFAAKSQRTGSLTGLTSPTATPPTSSW